MPKKRKEISVTELRRDLPMILQRLALLDESYVVMKNGRKACIITPVPGDDFASNPDGDGEGRVPLVSSPPK